MALGNYLASPKTLVAKSNLEKIDKENLNKFLKADLNSLSDYANLGGTEAFIGQVNKRCNDAVQNFADELAEFADRIKPFITAMKNQANSIGTKRNGKFYRFVKGTSLFLEKESNEKSTKKERFDYLTNLKDEAETFIKARTSGQNGGSILAQAKSKILSSKLKFFMAMVIWSYSEKELEEIREKSKETTNNQQQKNQKADEPKKLVQPPKLPAHTAPPIPPTYVKKKIESKKPEKVLFYDTKRMNAEDLRGVFSTIGGK